MLVTQPDVWLDRGYMSLVWVIVCVLRVDTRYSVCIQYRITLLDDN